jgi:peptide-methionine (S)-S-oxide reductase
MSLQKIVLGGGCFWCIEAVFQRIKGVRKTVSGYAGGSIKNPTYAQVSSGASGHAEVVEVTFDDSTIPLSDILDIFWHLHDPTTLNRQGADVGTQYRSAIFFNSPEQLQAINLSLQKLALENIYKAPITTEIAYLNDFYTAESYHQNYFDKHSSQTYCNLVISPKLQKLRQKYSHKISSG